MKIKRGDIIKLSDGRSVLVTFPITDMLGIPREGSICIHCCLHSIDEKGDSYCYISSLLKGGCFDNIPTDCVLLEVTDVETGN